MEKTKTAEQYIKELEWRSSALYYTLQRVHNTIGVIPRTLTAEIEERLKGGPLPEASAPLPPSPEPPVATTGLKCIDPLIPCIIKHPELYTGSVCGKCYQSPPYGTKDCPMESSQPIQGAVTSPEETQLQKYYDGLTKNYGKTQPYHYNGPKCVAGCKNFAHYETKHHPDCPFYKGSLSEQFDNLKRELEVKASTEQEASQFIQPSLPVLQLKEKIEEIIDACSPDIPEDADALTAAEIFNSSLNKIMVTALRLARLSESLSSSLPASSPEEKKQ